MRIIEGGTYWPLREYTQVELAITDAFLLGLYSLPSFVGDVAKFTTNYWLDQGSLTLAEGAIRAARHVHMTPQDAKIQS